MTRDAIANAIQEKWPQVKITDTIPYNPASGLKPTSSWPDLEKVRPHRTRINVDIPSNIAKDITIRVATIDIDDDKIQAVFYGGTYWTNSAIGWNIIHYTNNLHHPKSITDLEKLLAEHITDLQKRAKTHGVFITNTNWLVTGTHMETKEDQKTGKSVVDHIDGAEAGTRIMFADPNKNEPKPNT